MIHEIKLSHLFFDDVQSGKKNFELRRDDRNYQVDDVIYKLTGYVGLEPTYCILGIER